jgi:nucleotide-binding universal stress UspA family protein
MEREDVLTVMFQNLLVALDGSARSERAARMAGIWAIAFGGKVTLFHLVEPGAPTRVHGEPHLRGPVEAREYLEEASRRLLPGGRRDKMRGGLGSHG